MLSKVRHFVDKNTLALIYHAIFESHLFYTCLGSAQNTNFLKRLCFEKEISRLMYFLNRNTDTAPLFKDSHMLKFPEKTCLEIFFLLVIISTKPHQHPLKIGSLSRQIHVHIIQDGLI